MSRKRCNFSGKFKAEVVLSIIGGQASASEVCRKHGLKADLVSRWRSEFVERAHTVFGRVVEGMEIVTHIENLPRNANDHPMEDVVIVEIIID